MVKCWLTYNKDIDNIMDFDQKYWSDQRQPRLTTSPLLKDFATCN